MGSRHNEVCVLVSSCPGGGNRHRQKLWLHQRRRRRCRVRCGSRLDLLKRPDGEQWIPSERWWTSVPRSKARRWPERRHLLADSLERDALLLHPRPQQRWMSLQRCCLLHRHAGAREGGDWYCDANFVGGQWCPEYDTLESNKHTVAGTLHTCNGSPGNWNDCDRGGCQNNAFYVDSNMFCPEDRCTINTNRPFTVSHFQNGQQANIWMSQDGKEASFDFCSDGGYCSKMAQSYDGMVFSASLWGGNGINMDWLDGMTGCGGECNIGGSSVSFSNFALWG